jgi:hypothetical protein
MAEIPFSGRLQAHPVCYNNENALSDSVFGLSAGRPQEEPDYCPPSGVEFKNMKFLSAPL